MSTNVSSYWLAFAVLLGATTFLPIVDGSPMSTTKLPLGTLYVSRMTGWQVALLVHVTCCTLLALGFSLLLQTYSSTGSQEDRVATEQISDNRLSLSSLIFQLSAVSVLFGLAIATGLRTPSVFIAIAIPFALRIALAWFSPRQ